MTRRRRWKTRDLWDWFGVSSCAKIGRSLAESLVELHLSADQLNECSPHALHAERVLLENGALLHSRYRSLLVDDLELLALSVTDARRLVAVVEQALNEPLAATS